MDAERRTSSDTSGQGTLETGKPASKPYCAEWRLEVGRAAGAPKNFQFGEGPMLSIAARGVGRRQHGNAGATGKQNRWYRARFLEGVRIKFVDSRLPSVAGCELIKI